MLKKSSRHVLVFGVSVLIALVAVAQPVPAAAPSNGTLFGAVGCLFCTRSLDRLDPASGNETPVATLGGVFVDAMAADPGLQVLYVSASYGGGKGGVPGFAMFTFNSQTGAFSAAYNVISSPLEMALDPATHTLFGLRDELIGQNFEFGISRIDPASWSATHLATLPSRTSSLAFDPASHTLYTEAMDFSASPATGSLFAVNSQTGTVSAPATLTPAVFNLVYDTAAGALYGVAGGLPQSFVKIDPSTGAETPIGGFTFAGVASAATIDSASHTVYLVQTETLAGGEKASQIVTIYAQTGAGAAGPTMAQAVWAIAFLAPPITPDSIQTDVSDALTTGAIDNSGVASSLLAKLSAAAGARSRGQCLTAADVYASFINDLTAQRGKHVAAATAAKLTAEAQFLIANCP